MTGAADSNGDPGPAQATAAPAARTASASLVVWLLVGSAFVMILNETIMSVALPALVVDLGSASRRRSG